MTLAPNLSTERPEAVQCTVRTAYYFHNATSSMGLFKA